MNCPTCSTPIPDGSRVRMNCGADVSAPIADIMESLNEPEASHNREYAGGGNTGGYDLEPSTGFGYPGKGAMMTVTHCISGARDAG